MISSTFTLCSIKCSKEKRIKRYRPRGKSRFQIGFESEIHAFEAKFNNSRRAVLVWRSCRERIFVQTDLDW